MKPVMKEPPFRVLWCRSLGRTTTDEEMIKLTKAPPVIAYDPKACWVPPPKPTRSFCMMRLPSGELALADTLEELTEQLHQFDDEPH